MQNEERYPDLSWEERQKVIGQAKAVFGAYVYELKESGTPFTKMVEDPKIIDLYDKTYPFKRWEKWAPSKGVIAKAYARHCQSNGIQTELTHAAEQELLDEAIRALSRAGWDDYKIGRALGKSAANIKRIRQTPAA